MYPLNISDFLATCSETIRFNAQIEGAQLIIPLSASKKQLCFTRTNGHFMFIGIRENPDLDDRCLIKLSAMAVI